MKSLLFLILCGTTQMVDAVPPVNDAFAGRINVGSVASYSITTTNVEATVQSPENTLSTLMGATIWWQWTAPATGWVRMDTLGSEVDTVLKVTTTSGANAATFGFNDDEISGYIESSLTFQATQGTIYYIAVGGYDDGTAAETGVVALNISTDAADRPPNWPSGPTFSPPSANVTLGDVNVTATITVAGDAGQVGDVDLNLENAAGRIIYPPVVSSTSFTSGSVNAVNVITIPRYLQGGVWSPLLDLILADGTTLEFGNAASGRPYLTPVPTTLTVTNTGSSDIAAPVITAFSITPTSVNVNNGSVDVTVSATVTDNTSGVRELQAYLYSNSNAAFDMRLAISMTGGNLTNGTWTGTTTIPKEYPSGTYSVYVYVRDKALNAADYGEFGGLNFPGASALIDVTVVGGGAYWEWAYEYIYPYSDDVDLALDPNGDGLDNLTCYAFGLEPVFDDPLTDVPGVLMVGTSTKSLAFEFWRRVGATSGLTYQPQICDNLGPSNWLDFPGSATLLSATTAWEKMQIIDTENTATKPKRFARMKLTYVDN